MCVTCAVEIVSPDVTVLNEYTGGGSYFIIILKHSIIGTSIE